MPGEPPTGSSTDRSSSAGSAGDPTPESDRTAVVLAGGHSRRFGDRDKAVVPLSGTPLLRHVADRLAPAIDRLVVNCRAEQRDRLDAALAGYDHRVRFAIDDRPGEGPAAGTATGLRAVETGVAAVVACDLPFVDPALLAYCFDVATGVAAPPNDTDAGPPDAVVPAPQADLLEPTQAVYRTGPTISACEDALADDRRSLQAALDRLDYVPVGETQLRDRADPRVFENVNTPADLARAADLLEEPPTERWPVD